MKAVAENDKNVKLLIVGGTKEQVEEFDNLSKSLGLEDIIRFTGRVQQKLAKEYTNKADILLSPRSDGTNTPLKIYEQLASGKPLVATNIYSHTQVLTEDVCFLVDPNPEDMAKGILASLQNKADSQEKVKNALQLYEDQYSRKVYKTKLKKLLESL